MSKMNFNYSNKYRNNKTPKTEESEIKEEVQEEVDNLEDTIEEISEENILETAENNKITSVNETIEDLFVESIPSSEEVIEEKYGIIQNCELLNCRKEASSNSEILKVFNKNDKIKILDEVGEFYKVLSDNTEAYCMKKFIKII